MLVLRRRAGERVLIGDEIEIEVIEVSKSRVRLGIRAPSHVSVMRKETLTVARENLMASDLVASRGHEGVGRLLELLNRPEAAGHGGSRDGKAPTGEEGSTTPAGRRYETPERYRGYRGNRENPHRA